MYSFPESYAVVVGIVAVFPVWLVTTFPLSYFWRMILQMLLIIPLFLFLVAPHGTVASAVFLVMFLMVTVPRMIPNIQRHYRHKALVARILATDLRSFG